MKFKRLQNLGNPIEDYDAVNLKTLKKYSEKMLKIHSVSFIPEDTDDFVVINHPKCYSINGLFFFELITEIHIGEDKIIKLGKFHDLPQEFIGTQIMGYSVPSKQIITAPLNEEFRISIADLPARSTEFIYFSCLLQI